MAVLDKSKFPMCDGCTQGELCDDPECPTSDEHYEEYTDEEEDDG